MEMRIQKFVLHPDCKASFLEELEEATDKIRQARGFISGIILASKANADVIYYFTMWMDAGSIRDFEAWLPHFTSLHSRWLKDTVEEKLEVLLSVTREGDFKPVGDA